MTDVVAQILIDGYDSLKCECGVYNVSFARPFLLPFVIFFGQAFVGHRGNDHQLFAFALSSHSWRFLRFALSPRPSNTPPPPQCLVSVSRNTDTDDAEEVEDIRNTGMFHYVFSNWEPTSYFYSKDLPGRKAESGAARWLTFWYVH